MRAEGMAQRSQHQRRWRRNNVCYRYKQKDERPKRNIKYLLFCRNKQVWESQLSLTPSSPEARRTRTASPTPYKHTLPQLGGAVIIFSALPISRLATPLDYSALHPSFRLHCLQVGPRKELHWGWSWPVPVTEKCQPASERGRRRGTFLRTLYIQLQVQE